MRFLRPLLLFHALSFIESSCQALVSDYLWPLPSQVFDKNMSIRVYSFAFVANVDSAAFKYGKSIVRRSLKAKVGCHGDKSHNSYVVNVHVDCDSVLTPSDLVGANESYSIDMDTNAATITASTIVGAVYGLQTLSQLIDRNGRLFLADIVDSPSYEYRGLLLDTARNYFLVEDLKRILRGLAFSKLNVLHWHIYDSQSFPIKWPRYNDAGMQDAAFKDAKGHPKQYSQDDVQTVIAYAFVRNIRVIPCFETPGHNAVFGHIDPALISAWNHSPWDGNRFAANAQCSNETDPPTLVTNNCTVIWFGRNSCNQPPCGQLDVRLPAAIELLGHLIADVGSWFPDPILHVGHDEVNSRAYGLVPDRWDLAPVDMIYPLMRDFEPQLLKMLAANGKRYAAWDEVVDVSPNPHERSSPPLTPLYLMQSFGIESLLPKDAIVTVWNGPEGNGPTAARLPRTQVVHDAGFRYIVTSPGTAWYLDCSPSAHWCSKGYERDLPSDTYNISGFTTFPGQWHNWTLAYDYEPDAGVTMEARTSIKGGFGSMWTETIKRHNLDRFVFPRASAIAERLWSNIDRNGRTEVRLDRFRASLINEAGIDAAAMSYLGNGEGMIYRTEYCDTALTAAGQKTVSAGFPGEPTTGGDGAMPIDPHASHFAVPTDYCKIASLYNTNSFKPVKPIPCSYPF